MKTLLLIDIQNDFLPGGTLAVPAGDEVASVANRLMPAYDLVVATQDWHPADHLSFASGHPGRTVGDVIELDELQQTLWPEHCVQDTPGAAFATGLNLDAIHHVVQKGTDRRIDSYSGFFDNARRKATGLADYLIERGAQELDVMGLATDYCVKFTAIDAAELGFQTTFLSRGSRGIELNPGDCDKAVAAMRAAGVDVKEEIEQ